MILISHRGNINGRQEDLENTYDYIFAAIDKGYNVEIDVWVKNNKIFLGHDNPEHPCSIEFLGYQFSQLWIHAKNIEAAEFLSNYKQLNWFWHQEDTITLTSKGYIWAYPGKQPIKKSIAVMPELFNDSIDSCIGICSDYIEKYG